MRRLAIVAMLALAVPAFAANGKYVGTWFVGDNAHVLRMAVTDTKGIAWGTSVGKGYIPTLEVRRPDHSPLLLIVTGAWEDTTESAVVLSPGVVSMLYPDTTGSTKANIWSDYEAMLVLTKGSSVARLGADDQGTPFRFRIQWWP